MSEDQMQALVKDILAGVQFMFQESREETKAMIDASEGRIRSETKSMIDASESRIRNETRVLLEAQDKKISAIAEEVTSLNQRVGRLETRLDTLESDVKVIKAAVTAHSEEIYQLKRVK